MIGIDTSSLAKQLSDGTVVRNPETGKYILVRDGKDMETFENTIVHELFHAFMDDYTRTGMLGATDIRDMAKPDGTSFSGEQMNKYWNTCYPKWFIEGSASAVENVFTDRNYYFQLLSTGSLKKANAYTPTSVVIGYLSASAGNEPAYFDLWYSRGQNLSGEEIDDTASADVAGYLATLYLCELQARKNGSSSIVIDESNDTYSISSATLRTGLNSMLVRLHNGDTFDEVVRDISPVDPNTGERLYSGAMEFQKKFIKGPYYTKDEGFNKKGDDAEGGSLQFVVNLLNYLNDMSNEAGKTVNGTILDDFSKSDASMLNRYDDDVSDYLKIVESNDLVVSTVPDSEALRAGGLFRSGTPGHADTSPTSDDQYPWRYTVNGSADDRAGSGATEQSMGGMSANSGAEALPAAAKAPAKKPTRPGAKASDAKDSAANSSRTATGAAEGAATADDSAEAVGAAGEATAVEGAAASTEGAAAEGATEDAAAEGAVTTEGAAAPQGTATEGATGDATADRGGLAENVAGEDVSGASETPTVATVVESGE